MYSCEIEALLEACNYVLTPQQCEQVMDVNTNKQIAQNDFLIGYGLDYRELHRNVPYVYIPDEEEYNELKRLADNN